MLWKCCPAGTNTSLCHQQHLQHKSQAQPHSSYCEAIEPHPGQNQCHLQQSVTNSWRPWTTIQPTRRLKHFPPDTCRERSRLPWSSGPAQHSTGRAPGKEWSPAVLYPLLGGPEIFLRLDFLSKADRAALNHCEESALGASCSWTKGRSNSWSGSQRHYRPGCHHLPPSATICHAR